MIEAKHNQYRRSVQLFAAATTAHGDWCEQWLVELRDRCLSDTREALGDAGLDAAWAEGAQMTLKQAVDIVMAM